MKTKEKLGENRTPPLSWFIGHGFQDSGILTVLVSRKFTSIDERLYEKYVGWIVKPAPEAGEDEGIFFAQRREVEAYIQKVTGFSPQEIHAFTRELREKYCGGKIAPFKVQLVDADIT